MSFQRVFGHVKIKREWRLTRSTMAMKATDDVGSGAKLRLITLITLSEDEDSVGI